MALRRVAQLCSPPRFLARISDLLEQQRIPEGAAAALPSLADSSPLSSLLQKRWMAVPKSKVSKHRRGMRNSGKKIARIKMAAQCRACGQLMMPHMIHHGCVGHDSSRERLDPPQAAAALASGT